MKAINRVLQYTASTSEHGVIFLSTEGVFYMVLMPFMVTMRIKSRIRDVHYT